MYVGVRQGSNLAMSTEPRRGSDVISVRELAGMRNAGKEHTVLDVREARELDICRLEGALHIPMVEIPAQTDNLPTNQLLVVILPSRGSQSDGRRLSSKRRL
jgi:rhodanese-related sulfurtransferase